MLTKKGIITSAGKMKDTVTVTVHMQVRHPIYKKSFRKSKKFLADTKGVTDLAAGDEVIIQECRPLSKNKHFKIAEVLKRSPRVSEMVEEAGITKAIHREKIDETKDEKDEKPASSKASSSKTAK